MLAHSQRLFDVARPMARRKVPARRYSTSPKRDWRILFFGTGNVALASAKLLQSRSDLISNFEIVCPAQKDAKKPLPTQLWAMKNQIRVHEYRKPSSKNSSTNQAASPSEALDDAGTIDEITELAAKNFDIAVVVDFGYMLPSKLLSAFTHTPILMHPSLLPQYRGAAPMERCIMAGDKESGVTVLDVAPSKFDAGSILLSLKQPLDPRAPGTLIKQQLSELGAHALVQALERYEELQKTKIPQPIEASKAPKLTPLDYLAPLKHKSSIELYNQWRAVGTLTTHLFGCKHMKIYSEDGSIPVILHELCHPDDVKPSRSLEESAKAGTIVFDKPQNLLWVKCGQANDWAAVKAVQVDSGRRVLDIVSFINGIQFTKNSSQQFETVGL